MYIHIVGVRDGGKMVVVCKPHTPFSYQEKKKTLSLLLLRRKRGLSRQARFNKTYDGVCVVSWRSVGKSTIRKTNGAGVELRVARTWSDPKDATMRYWYLDILAWRRNCCIVTNPQ